MLSEKHKKNNFNEVLIKTQVQVKNQENKKVQHKFTDLKTIFKLKK